MGMRSHGRELMSEETALAGVEYLARHSVDSEHCALGFYGGEPFLSFDLVRLATAEARRKIPRDVHISLTTNGTLLDSKKMEWCVAEGVSLLVSLDGPREVHDVQRHTIEGNGTWNTVMRFLRTLRGIDRDYYNTHVAISCVIPYGISPLAVDRFFSRSPDASLLEGIRINATFEDTRGKKQNPPQHGSLHAEIMDLRQKFVRAILSGNVSAQESRLVRALFERPLLDLYKRSILPPGSPKTVGLNGMCIPGVRKLFVACNGTLYTCERVNEAYPLGNIREGLDVDVVSHVLGEYRRYSERRCRICWAARLCRGCLSSIAGPNGLDRHVSRRHCRSERYHLLDSLQVFCNILEHKPDALDYMEDITVS